MFRIVLVIALLAGSMGLFGNFFSRRSRPTAKPALKPAAEQVVDSRIVEITSDAHFSRVYKKHAYVYFGATWCRPCVQTKPVVKKVFKASKEKLLLIVDLDKCPETWKRFQESHKLHSVPTLFKQGEEPLVGQKNEKAVRKFLAAE